MDGSRVMQTASFGEECETIFSKGVDIQCRKDYLRTVVRDCFRNTI